MSKATSDKIIEIIANQAMVDFTDVNPQSTLEELGIESLALVESIFEIEEAFDISIPFNANAPEESTFDISSVGAIIEEVETLIAAKSQG